MYDEDLLNITILIYGVFEHMSEKQIIELNTDIEFVKLAIKLEDDCIERENLERELQELMKIKEG